MDKVISRGRMMLTLIIVTVLVCVAALYSYYLHHYDLYGKDNIHSQRAIEYALKHTYNRSFTVENKEFNVLKTDNGYEFVVHNVMSDSDGLRFDAYNYMYSTDKFAGDACEEDYYWVRDNYGDKLVERELQGKYDLTKYRTWQKLEEDESASDYTVIYDGKNINEAAEVIVNLFYANLEINKNSIVFCDVIDTRGNELFNYAFTTLAESMEKDRINISNKAEVYEFVKQQILNGLDS